MTTQYETHTSYIARASGYTPISDDYDLEKESDLLEKALAQLGSVKYCLVSDNNLDTIAIWRKKEEVDTIKAR
jgi:hypothetical protein